MVTYRPIGPDVIILFFTILKLVNCIYTCHVNKQITKLLICPFNKIEIAVVIKHFP